jgi:hypothetical protein
MPRFYGCLPVLGPCVRIPFSYLVDYITFVCNRSVPSCSVHCKVLSIFKGTVPFWAVVGI